MHLSHYLLKSFTLLNLFVPLHSQFLQSSSSFMPTRPVISPRLCFRINPKHGRVIRFISDQQTKCMYWECTSSRPVARQCGLQTYISEFFEGDNYNPCTEMYTDSTKQFDCTRKGFDADGQPTCKRLYENSGTCRNGGSVSTQGNLCWCKCAPGYSGFDCTKRGPLAIGSVLGPRSPPAVPAFRGTPSASPVPVGAQNSRPAVPAATNTARTRATNSSPISRRRIDRRRIVPVVRVAPHVNDDIDETGPILPQPRGAVPFSQTISQNKGRNPQDEVPPPGVEFAEDNQSGVSPVGVALPGTSSRQSSRQPIKPAAVSLNSRGVSQVVFSRNSARSLSLSSPVATVDRSGKFRLGDPCPRGFQKDFCSEQGGCLNGGTCVNQCLGAVCLCRPPYTAGRRCEQFRCTFDVECMNGGTCRRGVSGNHPVATCTCLAGFGGPMCEVNLASFSSNV